MDQTEISQIEDSIIPKINRQYLDSTYWENRYSQCKQDQTDEYFNFKTTTREWLGSYHMFADIFRSAVPKDSSILILGCGNSLLGEQLFNDGYQNVHNIDISESVIEMMSKHCYKCKQLKWSTMDCRKLDFFDEQFDVVIEKATIEVFFVDESSAWSISMGTLQNVQLMADEIIRVLKRQVGQFFSISFTASHFRQKLFNKVFIDNKSKSKQMKTIAVHQLGEHFHYYIYHLSNNPNCSPLDIFLYEPPKVTPLIGYSNSDSSDNNDDFFGAFNL